MDELRNEIADPEVDAVVITAPAGVGKTRLVQELTGGASVPPLWWQAAPAVASVPFGALADHLDLDLEAPPAEVFARLSEQAAAAGGVVVVDDAPHLDARSADLLHRLVDAGRATVVATARSGVEVPSWMEWLWLGERTRHHGLDPLEVDDVATLASIVLPDLGSTTTHSVDEIAASLSVRTGGNALFVRELLADLGRRVARGLPVELDAGAPPHLLRVLDARLRIAGPDVAEPLAAVSVLGSLALAVLHGRCGSAATSASELAGYLAIGDDHRSMVRPAHPLHAEAALSAMSATDRRALTEKVAAAVLDDGDATQSERLTATTALVDLGAPVDATHLLDAARMSFGALDHDLASRLAAAAIVAGDTFEAKLVLGAAHSGAGRTNQAEVALHDALGSASDDDQRARAAGRLAVHLVAHARRHDEAAALLDAVAAELTDPAALAFIAADQAKLASIRGGVIAVPTASDDGDGDDSLAALNGAIIGAYAQAMAGEAAACRATIERATVLAEAHRASLPWAGELVRFSGTFAALLTNGPTAAADEAATGLAGAAASSGSTAGTWRFLDGFSSAVAGRLDHARDQLALATAELDGHDLIGARPLAISAHAWVVAQDGELEAARDLLDASVDAAATDGRVRTQVAVAEAWCDAVEGRNSDATPRLLDAARAAAASGQVVSAVIVLNELVRLGAPTAATDALRALARTVPPSWLIRFVLARAEAEASGDDATLARLASRAEGRWPIAVVELHRARNVRARAAHDDVAAARSSTLAVVAAARLGSTLPWHLEGLTTSLTARELEVATSVATGASNREVAESAGVSVRTVENQLQSIYRKLGLGDRGGLRDLLAPRHP